MQTAVEWLEKEIYARGPIGEDTPIWLKELYEQAKEMEKQMVIDIVEKSRATGLTAEYLLLTYGSKGSDEHIVDTNEMIEKSEKPINLTSSQTEISDEEIKAFAMGYYDNNGADYYVELGAK